MGCMANLKKFSYIRDYTKDPPPAPKPKEVKPEPISEQGFFDKALEELKKQLGKLAEELKEP